MQGSMFQSQKYKSVIVIRMGWPGRPVRKSENFGQKMTHFRRFPELDISFWWRPNFKLPSLPVMGGWVTEADLLKKSSISRQKWLILEFPKIWHLVNSHWAHENHLVCHSHLDGFRRQTGMKATKSPFYSAGRINGRIALIAYHLEIGSIINMPYPNKKRIVCHSYLGGFQRQTDKNVRYKITVGEMAEFHHCVPFGNELSYL